MNDIKNFRLGRKPKGFAVLDTALPVRGFCVPYNLEVRKSMGRGGVQFLYL